MRTSKTLALVLGLGLSAVGCDWQSAYDVDPDAPAPWGPPAAEGNLVLSNGTQSGAMGEVGGYEGETFVATGSAYDGFASIRLESHGPGWWVMSLVDIRGATLDALEPGVTYATPISGVLETGEPDVSVVGCSGPSDGHYTFDTSAQRSELTVEDLGDGTRRCHVRSVFEFGGREQVAEASFDYVVAR